MKTNNRSADAMYAQENCIQNIIPSMDREHVTDSILCLLHGAGMGEADRINAAIDALILTYLQTGCTDPEQEIGLLLSVVRESYEQYSEMLGDPDDENRIINRCNGDNICKDYKIPIFFVIDGKLVKRFEFSQ